MSWLEKFHKSQWWLRLQLQGGEKWLESKYFLQVESWVLVRELEVENEKEGGAKNEALDSG